MAPPTPLPLSSLASLLSTLPSLAPFLSSLSLRLTALSPPSSIFIHAPTNTSLLLPLISNLLSAHFASLSASDSPPTVQDLLPRIAVLDLEEVATTRGAFDRVLDRLSGWSAGWREGEGGVLNWDGRSEGVAVRRKGKRAAAGKGKGRAKKRARRGEDHEEEVTETESEGEEEGDTWELHWTRGASGAVRDPVGPIRDTLDHFHLGLKTVFQLAVDAEKKDDALFPDPRARRWLIVNHGELLNDVATAGNVGGAPKETGMGMTFASTIYRLGQLTGAPITTITISNLSWIKAREGMVGLASPELLSFPALGSTDYVNLLTARFATSPPFSSKFDKEILVPLFHSLAYIVYETFGTTAKNNLDELAYLCAKFWPKWLLCVEQGNPPIPPTDIARLTQQLKPDFARELDQIAQPHQPLSLSIPTEAPTAPQGFSGHMPAPAPSGFPNLAASSEELYRIPSSHTSTTPLRRQAIQNFPSVSGSQAGSAPSSPSKSSGGGGGGGATATDSSLARSLPVLARWLLVASFYAGFNPVKSDVVFFVKIDEGIAKKGKRARKAPVRKPGTSPTKANVRSELTGGKAFPLERLLAIFEAIVADHHEYASQSVDVLMQVTTLINLRLLQRVSAQDKLLDGVKLKCRLTRDTVDVLARSVGLKDWGQFLWEAEA